MVKSESEDKKHEPFLYQLGASTLGEITAFGLAIGAVYVSERLAPKQTQMFVSHLAEKLGQWRGLSPDTQTVLAKKILDVSVMNMAGITGMAVQFGTRRANQSPDEKTSLWYEVSRLAVGRIVGTTTAIGALAFMGSKAPGVMKEMESVVSKGLGGGVHGDRFADLLVSSTVQSVGAIAGNVPSQLLYDYLVHPPEKSVSK